LATLLFGLPVLCSAALIIANANFAGEWTFNESKSKLGDAQFRMAPTTLKVSQDAKALLLTVQTIHPRDSHLHQLISSLLTVKKQQEPLLEILKKVSTTSWSSDGSTLTI